MASAGLGLSMKPHQLPSIVENSCKLLRSPTPSDGSSASRVRVSNSASRRFQPSLARTAASCKVVAIARVDGAASSSRACKSLRTPFFGSDLREHTLVATARRAPASRAKALRVCASSAAAAEGSPEAPAESGSELVKTIRLGVLFAGWYLFNIYFNIYNKQVLKVFPYAITCTLVQFAVGAAFVAVMWITGLYKRPSLSFSMLKGIIPLAIVHTLGNMFTNLSLGKVAVSFTHTIKAMEPAFSVLLSALFLGDSPQPVVILSLLPIMGGVAIASATEASFNWGGFLSAMTSNLTFQSRNVLSKKLMLKKEGSMDNIQLFSIITVLSFFILLIPTILIDGVKFTPAFMESAGLDVKQVMTRCILSGVCFHAYQQVSYMILQVVSPVTHSVGNCVKRIVVIISSVLVFRTPVSLLNGIGTSLALAGVFAYSRIKASSGKKAE